MNPLIVVSNRLPVSVARNNEGGFNYNHTSGGLGTAMSSLKLKNGYIWIGWPGIASDDLTEPEKKQITTKLMDDYGCVPVFQTEQQIANFYEGYSNDTLWPLFHYFPSYGSFKGEYWQAYQEVNQLYLQAILTHSSDNSTVWIHDYHLMLLPELVRNKLPGATIGFFLHIPFPSYEIFRQIPERSELIKGLLGADLVGFHIYDYARHFISSSMRLLGVQSQNGTLEYNGRYITVDTFPISIDYNRFINQLAAKESQQEIKALADSIGSQKLIVAVDRLDYSKGIMERLRGFELFLNQHPEYKEKVVLHMIESPSRTEVPAYKELRSEVEQMVSRINGAHSTYHWTPIVYLFQNFGFDKIVPLYHMADVALVTPMRDGMNLVAKEYVAAKADRPGVLVLSEMAGAADELIDAIQVNPNNTQLLADSIHQALSMPKREQAKRLKRMQKRVASYSVQQWGVDFAAELKKSGLRNQEQSAKRLTGKQADLIMQDYHDATTRLFMLDYDGTLRDTKPSDTIGVRPSKELKSLIKSLSQQPDTKVVLISGRSKDVLEKWFGNIPKLALVAEHGAWVKDHGQWELKVSEVGDIKPFLKIMQRYTLRTAGAEVTKKQFGAVWHYKRVSHELAFIRSNEIKRELIEATQGTDFMVHSGRKTIEVKPTSLNKSVIAREFTDMYPSDYIFAAGDETSDDALFTALPAHAHTVKVGTGNSTAKYQVTNASKLVDVLNKFLNKESA